MNKEKEKQCLFQHSTGTNLIAQRYRNRDKLRCSGPFGAMRTLHLPMRVIVFSRVSVSNILKGIVHRVK